MTCPYPLCGPQSPHEVSAPNRTVRTPRARPDGTTEDELFYELQLIETPAGGMTAMGATLLSRLPMAVAPSESLASPSAGRRPTRRQTASPFCPVRLLREWLDAAGIIEGALFQQVAKGGERVGDRLGGRAY
jgi:hypothetical protein